MLRDARIDRRAPRPAASLGELAAAAPTRCRACRVRGHDRHPAGGFTLVEMMVAILLLSVGLMGLAALSTTVTRGNIQSSTLTAASALAQERIERFRTESYGSIASGGDTRGVDGVTYTRNWTVTNDDPEAGLKAIAVTVRWSTNGRAHATTLTTIRGTR
jgi:type IV pilus assembly protein PilV